MKNAEENGKLSLVDELDVLLEECREDINEEVHMQRLLRAVEDRCAKQAEDTRIGLELWAYDVYSERYGDPLAKADRTEAEEGFCKQLEMVRQGHEMMMSVEEREALLVELLVRNKLFSLMQMRGNELVEELTDFLRDDCDVYVVALPLLTLKAVMVRRLGYADYGMITKLCE